MSGSNLTGGKGIGQRFLDHVRQHAPGVVIALWPGGQRQIDSWLSIGLVDLAFCHVPQAGEEFTSRVLVDDKLVMVSTNEETSAQLGSGYVLLTTATSSAVATPKPLLATCRPR